LSLTISRLYATILAYILRRIVRKASARGCRFGAARQPAGRVKKCESSWGRACRLGYPCRTKRVGRKCPARLGQSEIPCCPSEWAWVLHPPQGMEVAVILSEAKDLCSFLCFERLRATAEILRFAQDDRLSRGRSEESPQLAFISRGGPQCHDNCTG